MFVREIGHIIKSNITKIPGWRSKRKIVVIESDDWGSIRTPSKVIYDSFLKKGYNLGNSNYNRFDSLECNEDLIHIFNILSKHHDKNHRCPVLTANTIMANPDFDKIAASGYNQYAFEHFTDTIKGYPRHDQVLSLYKEGMYEGIFHPQFHGREHLNVNRWMKKLKEGSDEIMFTFRNRTTFSGKEDYNFMEALEYDDPSEIPDLISIVEDGLKMFHETFGYNSKSFISPSYIWHSDIEDVLNSNGVRYIQGILFQYIPKGKFGEYTKRIHYLGQKNHLNQLYLIRNSLFEPSLMSKPDWVNYTLNNINTAFRWHKPAIISTHRINFMGFLNEKNRIENLKLFDELLRSIIKKWPDVEFMTSDELGDLMNGANEDFLLQYL